MAARVFLFGGRGRTCRLSFFKEVTSHGRCVSMSGKTFRGMAVGGREPLPGGRSCRSAIPRSRLANRGVIP